ncbi:hypothetical protein DXZ79_17105 [Yersinia rochesterensis]|uniref:Uncharacterized protein n=1 Tax=Yersinia rochesterensis TaxID=1604335 RepID=A0A8D4SRJ8_9GAMM|nr:hypothetical protein DXZ79_17105 [Yersinia rochesterensis]
MLEPIRPYTFHLANCRCWLHSITRITYLCKLIGIISFTAFLHLEIYWVYLLTGMAIRKLSAHSIPSRHRRTPLLILRE